jgi:hypothetical protein
LRFRKVYAYFVGGTRAPVESAAKSRHIYLAQDIQMTDDSAGQAGAHQLGEIEITPRMVAAGLETLRRSGAIEIPLDSDELLVAEIYQSMAIAAAHEGTD